MRISALHVTCQRHHYLPYFHMPQFGRFRSLSFVSDAETRAPAAPDVSTGQYSDGPPSIRCSISHFVALDSKLDRPKIGASQKLLPGPQRPLQLRPNSLFSPSSPFLVVGRDNCQEQIPESWLPSARTRSWRPSTNPHSFPSSRCVPPGPD